MTRLLATGYTSKIPRSKAVLSLGKFYVMQMSRVNDIIKYLQQNRLGKTRLFLGHLTRTI